MESSRRDLLNDMAEHRPILKNNQYTFYTRFGFIPKTGMAFSKIGVLFSPCSPKTSLMSFPAGFIFWKADLGICTVLVICFFFCPRKRKEWARLQAKPIIGRRAGVSIRSLESGRQRAAHLVATWEPPRYRGQVRNRWWRHDERLWNSINCWNCSPSRTTL